MSDLSGHDWITCLWRQRRALVCGRCGYLWKPPPAALTKPCAAPGVADRKEEPTTETDPGARHTLDTER